MGQGIKDSGVPREEIWLTTKLDNTWHHIVSEGIETSLKDLDTEYVDLYLMVSNKCFRTSISSRLMRTALAVINGS